MSLKPKQSDVDFGPSLPTSDSRIRYERRGVGHWRMIQVGTGQAFGPTYRSERELLADLPRIAADLEEQVRLSRPRGPGRPRKGYGTYDD